MRQYCAVLTKGGRRAWRIMAGEDKEEGDFRISSSLVICHIHKLYVTMHIGQLKSNLITFLVCPFYIFRSCPPYLPL